jgi:hypothetical protein
MTTTQEEKQAAVQNLREGFNDVIEIAKELNVDPASLEDAKQAIIGQIVDACPEADPGTFIELADGRWTLLKHIRENPEKFVRIADGRWTARETANVVKPLRPEPPWWEKDGAP